MSKKKKKVYKVGRPTKYRKAYCAELVNHMAQGLSFETFGAVIGVPTSTLYLWAKSEKDFMEAKKAAFLACQYFWERLGVAGASGQIKGFNTGAWIFNMKNRFKWQDVKGVDVELSSTIKKDIDRIKEMPAEEAIKMAKQAQMFLEGEIDGEILEVDQIED